LPYTAKSTATAAAATGHTRLAAWAGCV